MNKVTRADVAQKARVSTATVSNVFNKAHMVKEETVARVMAAVQELNYRPNMVARSLSTRKTMQIGIVLENIRNPYYGELVEYFESEANKRGYFVNICIGTDKLDDYLDNFIARGVDGAFVAVMPYKFNMEKLYSLLEHDIRLVISGNTDVDSTLLSSIENDYVLAMQNAIEYLMSLGHRNIAYLSGLSRSFTYDQRCATYLMHIESIFASKQDKLFVDGEPPYHTDEHTGYQQAMRLISRGVPFTAVICGNDLMALGAMRALRENNLRIPDDVSVMGFDGISIVRYSMPSLTTMAVDSKAFGTAAFELLYENMLKGTIGTYRSKLVFREGESTGRVSSQ